jgi:hypothetical protein
MSISKTAIIATAAATLFATAAFASESGHEVVSVNAEYLDYTIDGSGRATVGGRDISDLISPMSMVYTMDVSAGQSCSNTNCGCKPK